MSFCGIYKVSTCDPQRTLPSLDGKKKISPGWGRQPGESVEVTGISGRERRQTSASLAGA